MATLTHEAMDRALPFPPLNWRRSYERACRLARLLDAMAGAGQAESHPVTHVLCCAYWRAYDRQRAISRGLTPEA